MENFDPGDKVGIISWVDRGIVAAGPFTLLERSSEPNMWKTREHPYAHIIYSDFFHWQTDSKEGGPIPVVKKQKTLSEVLEKKLRNRLIETGLEKNTGLSASPGMGWADLIRAYSGDPVPKGAESAWSY